MTKLFAFCSFLFLCFASAAQNLVPNPSFEEHTGCPEGFPDLDGVCHDWMSFRLTPDYFHDCSEWCGYNTSRGFQLPHSGLAYAGINVFKPTLPNQGNEHIGVELQSPLVIGTEYFVSFFVSCGFTPLLVNIATNKIGALFTVNAYSDPTGARQMPNDCQIYTDEIVADTINWTLISGSFVADSAYQYLVIGNFFEDPFLDTLNHPFSVLPQTAFYFLDDVCVSADSLCAHKQTNIEESKGRTYRIQVYPNPSSGKFIVLSIDRIVEVCIMDLSGRLILKSQVNEQQLELDLSTEAAGLYMAGFLLSNGNREIIKVFKE
jgi:hypothetical protein